MYKSDKLYDEMKEIECRLNQIEITDEDSLIEYFKLYTDLIYNYKWLGSLYDIYEGDAFVLRGNGKKLNGAAEVVKDTTELLAAFPDLEMTITDMFAVRVGKDRYKLWRRFYLDGTNLGYSVYGAPTGKALEGKKAMGQSMADVELVGSRWSISYEYTMLADEWLRQVCTQ